MQSRKLARAKKLICQYAKEDWQLIDDEVDAIEDPLFGEMIAEDYQRLYQFIADHDFVAEKSG